jgi:hypothetical protein
MRLYFKGHAFANVIYEGFDKTGSKTFDWWLAEKDWNDEMDGYDEDFMYHRAEFAGINVLGNMGTRKEWVYDISEDWKHPLVDRMCMEIDIDDAEKIISEIGIRKVMKKYKESDYYNDDTFPDLSTDLGIRQVFYVLLDERLNINDEYYEEITKQEYDEWIDEHIQEDDDDEEDEDDNDGAIVPITDEAFVRIGGGVAPSA